MYNLNLYHLFLLLLFLLFGFKTQAQESATLNPEQLEELQQTVDQHASDWAMTPAQKAAYFQLTQKYAEQMLAVKNSDRSNWGKYRKLLSIRSAKNKEMKELLNAEQYEQYLEVQEAFQKKMSSGGFSRQ